MREYQGDVEADREESKSHVEEEEVGKIEIKMRERRRILGLIEEIKLEYGMSQHGKAIQSWFELLKERIQEER